MTECIICQGARAKGLSDVACSECLPKPAAKGWTCFCQSCTKFTFWTRFCERLIEFTLSGNHQGWDLATNSEKEKSSTTYKVLLLPNLCRKCYLYLRGVKGQDPRPKSLSKPVPDTQEGAHVPEIIPLVGYQLEQTVPFLAGNASLRHLPDSWISPHGKSQP